MLARPHNPIAARLLLFLVRHRVPVLTRLCEIVLGGDISCPLPHPVWLPHPYGITIHCGAVIGRNVVLMQQVTIGGRYDDNRAPVIEDDVFIGAGARIIGPIRVGRGAKIGANAVVFKDVPPGATVVGFGQIVKKAPPVATAAAAVK
jgi:serine O-acetyltransferase